MFIIIEHEISNPKTFWEVAKTATAALPSHLKVHVARNTYFAVEAQNAMGLPTVLSKK